MAVCGTRNTYNKSEKYIHIKMYFVMSREKGDLQMLSYSLIIYYNIWLKITFLSLGGLLCALQKRACTCIRNYVRINNNELTIHSICNKSIPLSKVQYQGRFVMLCF